MLIHKGWLALLTCAAPFARVSRGSGPTRTYSYQVVLPLLAGDPLDKLGVQTEHGSWWASKLTLHKPFESSALR